jgi:hypothetical protein
MNYYEKQLSNDEIFFHQLYKYTTDLMEEHAKLRDIDDVFLEYLKKTILETSITSDSPSRKIFKSVLESYAGYLFQMGETRDRKVDYSLRFFFTTFSYFFFFILG